MKQYGANKSTDFSRKQIGVIYGKAKSGELKVEKWVMKDFYDLADYYGYDDNRSVESAEKSILKILDAVFSKEDAQTLIDNYTAEHFGLMSRKNQQNADRNFI